MNSANDALPIQTQEPTNSAFAGADINSIFVDESRDYPEDADGCSELLRDTAPRLLTHAYYN
jgi:hypothetical protein